MLIVLVNSSALRKNDKVTSNKSNTQRQRSSNQAKRDISLSYAATNIDSKEGTRVKTITVIKNIEGNDNNNKSKLVVDPKMFENGEWASAFRDNFDSYGSIPDVPDIDDLFEFVNKKKTKEVDAAMAKSATLPVESKKTELSDSVTKAATTESAAQTAEELTTIVNKSNQEQTVEKIKGDAEIIPNVAKHLKKLKSQSLDTKTSQKRLVEPLVNLNYSTDKHLIHQYFENYILPQQSAEGYDYAKPCGEQKNSNAVVGSVTINTSSGRNYNVPAPNQATPKPPYLAPAVNKNKQVPAPVTPALEPPYSSIPGYSINSVVPPINKALKSFPQISSSTTLPNPSLAPVTFPQINTSTKPPPLYIAPSVRNNVSVAPTSPGSRRSPNYRSHLHRGNANRHDVNRSRGLKY